MSEIDKPNGKDQRTRWAEDRTILANERTYSAWMGTGLGSVGIAIALKAVFGATDPTWVAKLVASLFLGVAILIYWMACRQAQSTWERLNSSDSEPLSSSNFQRLTWVMTLATLATGGVLWSL